MGTLKVISYNVNRSSERDSNDKVTHFIEKNRDADVYCFQLISKTLLEQVVLTLGERFSSDRAAAFAPYDDEDGFGLALLVGSPLEILSIGEHRLGDEKIYAITAAIQGFGSKPGGLPISLTVCCVHLDNTSERKRLNQLSDLQKSEALTNKEALVIGDFNGEFFFVLVSQQWNKNGFRYLLTHNNVFIHPDSIAERFKRKKQKLCVGLTTRQANGMLWFFSLQIEAGSVGRRRCTSKSQLTVTLLMPSDG